MAYQKTEWMEFETLVSADNLNKIEDQLESVTDAIEINEMAVKSMAETVASHKGDYVSHPAVVTTTNSGNDYAVTLNPAPSEYMNGMGLIVTINADSTAAATINVNGLGAIPIKKANGNSVSNLKENGVYTLRYSSAQSGFILQGEGGEYGNAIANEVLAGKTIGTENGIIKGTMPNRGTFNLGVGVSVPAGYYSGGTTSSGLLLTVGDLEIYSGLPTDKPVTSEVVGGNWTYGKVSSVTIRAKGKVRVSYRLRSESTNYTAYARIFKNGKAYGTPWYTTSTTYVLCKEDITVSAGDTIELWAYSSVGGYATAYVIDFKIYVGNTDLPLIE